MANLSPADFFPDAKRIAAQRRQRSIKGGAMGAIGNALGDFVSMTTPVPAVAGPAIPAVAPNTQPIPPNLQAALPATTPSFFLGPPPAGFLPTLDPSLPNVDGAVPQCCPSYESMLPPGNNPSIFGNAVTTVEALSNTLAPFAPPASGMTRPDMTYNLDLATAGLIQRSRQPYVPTMSVGTSTARPGAMSVAIPPSIRSAFNLLAPSMIALEPEQITGEVAMFNEKSYSPGTGQGANSIGDKDKITGLNNAGATISGLSGLGIDLSGASIPGWVVAAGLIGAGLWYWKK